MEVNLMGKINVLNKHTFILGLQENWYKNRGISGRFIRHTKVNLSFLG